MLGWGVQNLLEWYWFAQGPFATLEGQGRWLLVGSIQMLGELCLLLGYYVRLMTSFLAVMATLTLAVPEAIILGQDPSGHLRTGLLGRAIVLFAEGGGNDSLDDTLKKTGAGPR